MSKGPQPGHSFPSDFGFTGSSGRISVRPHSRAPRTYAMGGPVKASKGGSMRKIAKEEISKRVARPAPKGHRGLRKY